MSIRPRILLAILLLPITVAAQNTPIGDSIITTVETITLNDLSQDSMISPNYGFSLNTLLRGLLGLFSLVVIAFIFSANRKAINWKTAGIGLGIQLILAIGILKVPAIQWFFNVLGGFF